jgi:hypothetical protein
MYKNYMNLENFNHKLVIIFLEDGKMASTMTSLSLESGKMVLYTWWLHHKGSISCDHMVSPKGLSNGTQRHVTFNIQVQKRNLLQEQKIFPAKRQVSMS